MSKEEVENLVKEAEANRHKDKEKKELVEAIVAKTEMAKKDVLMVIETMAEVVKHAVTKEAVEVPGLVKLEKKHRAARKC